MKNYHCVNSSETNIFTLCECHALTSLMMQQGKSAPNYLVLAMRKIPCSLYSSIPAKVTDMVRTINFKQQEVPELFSVTPLLFIHQDESQALSLPCQNL